MHFSSWNKWKQCTDLTDDLSFTYRALVNVRHLTQKMKVFNLQGFFWGLLAPLEKEKCLEYYCRHCCISFDHFASELSVNGMWGPGHGRCASGWFTTGIQVFLRASLPWACLKASQPLAQELEAGGMRRVEEGRREGSCVFALALATAHTPPPQNSRMELLTECVFCLRNLGKRVEGLLGKVNMIFWFLHSSNYISAYAVCL